MMFDRAPQGRRRAALFGVLAGMPLAAWLLWRRAIAGTATNRELGFHPLWHDVGFGAIRSVSGWVMPRGPESMLVKGIVALAVVGLIAAGIKRLWKDDGFGAGYARVTLVFLLSYGVFLTVAITFLDAQSSTTSRFLVPVLVAAIPVVVAGVSWRVMRFGIVFLVIYLAPGALGDVRWLHSFGTGYTAVRWQRLRLEQLAASIPGPIYSNLPEAVYFRTGRLALEVPAPTNRWSHKPNREYASEFSAMRKAIDVQQGAVVYFDFVPRSDFPRADTVARRLGATIEKWRPQVSVISRSAPH
jgi:hypothetical protein